MGEINGASTFAKGLRVLECFEAGAADLTMADISRMTGFDRATSRRLCLTLEDSGYLIRSNRTFRLAPRIVALAGGYLSSHHIGKVIQPVLNQLAESLHGDVAMAVRDGTRAVYVARSAVSTARLSFGFSVGSTLPLLPTAIGRMLLAQCPEPQRDVVISACVPTAFTPQTETAPDILRLKIIEAAREGYAFASNEFELGTAGVAVGCGYINGCEAALGVTEAVTHFEHPGRIAEVLDLLSKAAIGLKRHV